MEALREATEFTRSLSSPQAFLVFMAELLADGFEVTTTKIKLNRVRSMYTKRNSFVAFTADV